MKRVWLLTVAAVLPLLASNKAGVHFRFDPDAVNSSQTQDTIGPGCKAKAGASCESNAALRAQILLDRAHFSPGQIDGRFGDNLRAALYGFQAARKIPMTGVVDAATWKALDSDTQPLLITYTVTPDDVKGPFVHIPRRMDAQGRLKCTCYETPQEELGEHFHIDPKLLAELNPGTDIGKPGAQILVPNVLVPFNPPMAAAVVVSKSNQAVTAFNADGSILAQYPATMGSSHDPLPIGLWKIAEVKHNPWYYYNPKLFWDANPHDARAKIPPGPNNPVGLVWMGLSKEHYGIHGTPEPANIGHTESHGCIRLTNWDALELSRMVQKGTPVNLTE